ncbi:MAG: FHA domain-containing protein, partial [Planctomycetales bacterium]
MPEVAATGPGPNQFWKQPITDGETVRVGRSPRTGWEVPWDPYISREHADVTLNGDVLTVQRLGTAQNPIIFQGNEVDEAAVPPGERFQIGDTLFQLVMEDDVQVEADEDSS